MFTYDILQTEVALPSNHNTAWLSFWRGYNKIVSWKRHIPKADDERRHHAYSFSRAQNCRHQATDAANSDDTGGSSMNMINELVIYTPAANKYRLPVMTNSCWDATLFFVINSRLTSISSLYLNSIAWILPVPLIAPPFCGSCRPPRSMVQCCHSMDIMDGAPQHCTVARSAL